MNKRDLPTFGMPTMPMVRVLLNFSIALRGGFAAIELWLAKYDLKMWQQCFEETTINELGKEE